MTVRKVSQKRLFSLCKIVSGSSEFHALSGNEMGCTGGHPRVRGFDVQGVENGVRNIIGCRGAAHTAAARIVWLESAWKTHQTSQTDTGKSAISWELLVTKKRDET